MSQVNVRELRNHGGDVLDRVGAGEVVTIVRSGSAVAELRPLPRRGATARQLIDRRRHLPRIDVDALRADVDSVLDSSL